MAKDAQSEVWKLVEDIKVCMMTTRDGGVLRSRPMHGHHDEKAGELLFLTSLTSDKVDELNANPDVNLSYAKPGDDNYVSVSGKARVSRDRAKIDEVWNVFAKAYLKNKDDPDTVLVIVSPSQAEYWEGANTLKQAWETVKGAVSNATPDMGENRKVAL